MRKPVASQMEFDALVRVLEALPTTGPGLTAQEIHEALRGPYSPVTLTGILNTQVIRGWAAGTGRGETRRYHRVIHNVRATLAELITVV